MRTGLQAGRWAALPIAALLMLTAAGCDSGSGAASICKEAAGATLCVVPRDQAYRIQGHDFLPGSEFRMTGGDGGPHVLNVGPDGRVPPSGGVLGLLPGPGRTETHITATSVSGQPVSFTIVCEPPAGNGGELCKPRFA